MIRAIFLSDLHTGSRVGLCTEHPTNPDGSGYVPNDTQKRLYDKWCEVVYSDLKDPDVLILNGDAIDGKGYKDKGVEQWTTSVRTQVDQAKELVEMWGAKEIYVLRGSNYHCKLDGDAAEETLARELGAKWPQGNDKSGLSLYLTLEGVTFHVAHQIATTRVWHYRSTPIAREMLFATLNDAFRGLSADASRFKTRVVVRAHVHYYWHVESTSHAGFLLPAWQAQSPFMAQLSALGMMPDVGVVSITVEGDTYEYQKKTWKLETIQAPAHAIVGRMPKRGRTGGAKRRDRRS